MLHCPVSNSYHRVRTQGKPGLLYVEYAEKAGDSVWASVLPYLIVEEFAYTGLQISWQDICVPDAKGTRVAGDGFPKCSQRVFSLAFLSPC